MLPSLKPGRSSGPPTRPSRAGDWHWEVHPGDLLEGLPAEACEQVERIARELVVRDFMARVTGL
jgi:hypothetical protein